ncbi:MAG: YaeQ family protein [Gemmatimonadaceae bacterium]|jgi:uncharacterized protein YaeQ|nr:YaeQ family protein [Gemmatimonadaceae bacterium]
MALTATISTFDITLSDVDRHVYETLSLKVARHPSETAEYCWTRVLAYCLEYQEGIAFSKGGISDPDDPPLMVRDLTGALQVWVEIGAPDAARLHKAAKASPRVALYTHREPRIVLRGYEGATIHRAAEIPVYAVDRALLAELAPRLERRVRCALSVTDRQLYLDFEGTVLSGEVEEFALPS